MLIKIIKKGSTLRNFTTNSRERERSNLEKGKKPSFGKTLRRFIRWSFATLPRRIVSSILIALFIIGPISFLLFKNEAKASWWDERWQFRQKIQLTNSTGADLTDFQVSTTVDTASLITAGKMITSTCADMRFTDSKGQPLDYWIEENNPGCGNASTKVWIKAPKVYSGTNATSIYMYYGNPSATAVQSGDKTFEFFDDFDDGTINSNKWDQMIMGTGGTITETGGAAVLAPTNATISSANLKSKNTFTNNIVTEARRKLATDEYYMDFSLGSGVEAGMQNDTDWWHTTLKSGYIWEYQSSGVASNGLYRKPASGAQVAINTSAFTLNNSTYKVYKMSYSSTGALDWSIDGVSQVSGTDSTFLSDAKKIMVSQGEYSNGHGADQSVDYIFTRKYASTDPTTSASAEETGPGPVAYWKFDDPTSTPPGGTAGQAARDSTVNGNDGVLGSTVNADSADPTWKPESECVSGKCLSFDGSDDYVSAGAGSSLPLSSATGEFSLIAWVRTSATNAAILGFRDSVNINPVIDLQLGFDGVDNTGTGTPSFTIRGDNGIGLTHIHGTTAINDNKWHQVVATRTTAKALKIYVDGVQVASGTDALTSAVTTDTKRIGDESRNSSITNMNGSIDEVKIYPYARTSAQVKQDYNAGLAGQSASQGAAAAVGESPKWMTDGLVGHWKMDEASGTAVADASGNANTGTLTNAQETGTAQTGSDTVSATDPANAALSGTDDAYNNMIFRITGGTCGVTVGTERTITDYTGGSKTFAFSALSASSEGCTFEVRHQTGGKFGNGLGFEGTDDKVYINGSTSLNNLGGSATLSAWVKPSRVTGNQYILNRTNTYNRISLANDKVECKVYSTASSWATVTGNLAVTNNAWNLVSCVYDGSKLRIFVNGVLDSASASVSGTINSDNLQWQIGNYYYSGLDHNQFLGTIDDVRIYNRALSPDEVKQLSEWGPGPVGYWKMDENVSGASQTIKDYSGNGYNGTTYFGSNGTGMNCEVSGKYGGGCQLDGSGDRVRIPATSGRFSAPYGGFSFGLWFYPRSYSNYWSLMTNYDTTTGYTWSLQGVYNQPKLTASMEGTGGNATVTGDTISNFLNNWHHAEVVKTNTSITIYLDGKVYATATNADYSPYDVANQYLSIGTLLSYSTNWPFNGVVDDVRIYNYARTPKQVVEDMNAGHPIGGSPVGSPIAHWKFDEGHDATAQDSSQNNKDLTLSTASAWTNSGKFGRAFDGADNRRVADNADDNDLDFAATADFALTGWVKSTDNPAATQYIVNKASSTTGYTVFMQTDGDIVFGIGDINTLAGSFPEDTAGNVGRDFADGAWHHYAAVKTSNTRIDLYVDGNLIGSDTSLAADATLENLATLYLGDADAADGTNEFLGEIDEVKVYNSALTSDQIAIDMNQGKEMQLGGQVSATGATGQAAEYCVPGDSTSCAGPVGEWKFDEKTGGSVNDTSGNGQTGNYTFVNTRGVHGGAASFDGSNSVWFASSSSLMVQDAITVEAWAKFNEIDANDAIIAKHTHYTFSKLSSNLMNFTFYDGGTYRSFTSNKVFDSGDLGQWFHVVATYSQSSGIGNIYINGILDKSTNVGSYPFNQNNGQGYIAACHGCVAEWRLNGALDDVRVFGYARTPAQVAWDYNRGKPVGHWKMDEGEGDQAYDSSGNGNTGTLTTMDPPNDWVAGKFGKALDFDGSDDYVSLPSSVSLPSAYTISAWINLTSYASSGNYQSPIFGEYNSGTTDTRNYLNVNGTTHKVTFDQYTPAGGPATSSTSISLGTWYHIVGVQSATNSRKLYINGIEEATSTEVYNGATPNLFAIGRRLGSSQVDKFNGQIDDVRIFNYALTAEQVRQTMNEGSAIRFGE